MDKNRLKDVMVLISDFRDSANDAITVHIELIQKLSNDMLAIAEKPDSECSDEDRIIYKYYKENLFPIVSKSVKAIEDYSGGTDKYISALTQFIEIYKND